MKKPDSELSVFRLQTQNQSEGLLSIPCGFLQRINSPVFFRISKKLKNNDLNHVFNKIEKIN